MHIARGHPSRINPAVVLTFEVLELGKGYDWVPAPSSPRLTTTETTVERTSNSMASSDLRRLVVITPDTLNMNMGG